MKKHRPQIGDVLIAWDDAYMDDMGDYTEGRFLICGKEYQITNSDTDTIEITSELGPEHSFHRKHWDKYFRLKGKNTGASHTPGELKKIIDDLII